MAKRKRSRGSSFNDFFTDLTKEAIETATEPAIKRLGIEMAKKFGVSGLSAREQIALTREQNELKRQEMENQMYAMKLEEKELVLQEKRRHLGELKAEKEDLTLPNVDQVIDGALTIPQDRGGIVYPDENEGFQEWIESLPFGNVILILGRRGSGKTALAARLAEYLSATFGLAVYWVGLPEIARNLLPHWIKIIISSEL